MDLEIYNLRSLCITPSEDGVENIKVSGIEVDDGLDYSEDDEEEEEGVILGFAEKPRDPVAILSHFFPSKSGGVPAWLDLMDLPSEGSHACGFCGDSLQFLLQVYAPLHSKVSTFHRTLFVFVCPSMSCLLKDQHEQGKPYREKPRRSVKVFRCQLAQDNPFYSYSPPRNDGSSKPLSTGAILCSWCGTWKGDKVCSSCRKARYCSEKHQVAHWRAGHKAECHLAIISSPTLRLAQRYAGDKLSFNKVPCKTLWPEYEIIVEEESAYDGNVGEANCHQTSIVPRKCESDEAFHSLLDKFDADDVKKSWASFQERIGRAPQQVLRYCREPTAKPLWPTSTGCLSKQDIPSCRCCNGPSVYEFQIMPQLLYYLGVKNDPDSLDWATISIYSCSDSCESGLAYKEEFPWVQLYMPQMS